MANDMIIDNEDGHSVGQKAAYPTPTDFTNAVGERQEFDDGHTPESAAEHVRTVWMREPTAAEIERHLLDPDEYNLMFCSPGDTGAMEHWSIDTLELPVLPMVQARDALQAALDFDNHRLEHKECPVACLERARLWGQMRPKLVAAIRTLDAAASSQELKRILIQ